MFRLASQPGIIVLLHSEKQKPLALWDKRLREGELKRVIDPELKSFVLELTGNRALTNYIVCPADVRDILGIKYPYLHVTVKSMPNKFFAVDVQILDDRKMRRRFRASTIQGFLDVQPFMAKIPLSLEDGWNEITIPLHRYAKDLYNATYVETLRIQIYANCSLKRIYFSDKEYKERELPKNCKIFGFEDTEQEILKKQGAEAEASMTDWTKTAFGLDLMSFLTFFKRT